MITSPAQNRVTPLGDVIAVSGRGAWMGNRGLLHRGNGTREVVRSHRNRAWLTCVLSFRERRVPQWVAGRYTPLFFLDEAVAFAAGHRPCAECRRSSYNAYRAAWPLGRCRAPEIDAQLHDERLAEDGRRQLHRLPWADLPSGVFVTTDSGPAVVADDRLVVFDPARYAYGSRLRRPYSAMATVITPPSTIEVLRAGYPVQLDPAVDFSPLALRSGRFSSQKSTRT